MKSVVVTLVPALVPAVVATVVAALAVGVTAGPVAAAPVVSAALVVSAAPAATTASVPITPGEPTTATISSPGERPTFGFRGQAGQRVTVTVPTAHWTGSSSDGSGYVSVVLVAPDGTDKQILAGTAGYATFGASQPLPSTGHWRIRLVPNDRAVRGSQTMTLNLVRDQERTLAVGRAATARLSRAGQRGVYSFHGTAGLTPSLLVASADWTSALAGGSGYADATLYRPNGSEFGFVVEASQYPAAGTPERGALDVTGTWTLVVVPHADSVGEQRMVLHLDDVG